MPDKMCKHGKVLCVQCVIITDDARRMRDGVNLALITHAFEEVKYGWMAFALADGQTDHVVYPSKKTAIAHMRDEYRYAYLCLNKCAGGMPLKDAQLWLDLHRHAYAHSGRMTDPTIDLILPMAHETPITHEVTPDTSLAAQLQLPQYRRRQ
jgi:hypothetical protein